MDQINTLRQKSPVMNALFYFPMAKISVGLILSPEKREIAIVCGACLLGPMGCTLISSTCSGTTETMMLLITCDMKQ